MTEPPAGRTVQGNLRHLAGDTARIRQSMTEIAPGWYKDPAEPTTQRYWDGEGWIGDPLPADLTPPPGPPPPPPRGIAPPARPAAQPRPAPTARPAPPPGPAAPARPAPPPGPTPPAQPTWPPP